MGGKPAEQPLCGLLNVEKPAGWTSRDVVNLVQGCVRPAKAGHAGTLDPLATGVLLICIGRATRLIEYVQALPKQYEAVFLLGRTSPTDDLDSPVVEEAHASIPPQKSLQKALQQWTGEVLQKPPAYSALKVAGRRAYQIARRGQTVHLEPRPVSIYAIHLLAYEYPELQIRVDCGRGTYIRALGRDLAAECQTTAVLAALRRTRVGSFAASEAILSQQVSERKLSIDVIRRHLSPPLMAVSSLPRLEVGAAEKQRLLHGQQIRLPASRVPTGRVPVSLDHPGSVASSLDSSQPGPESVGADDQDLPLGCEAAAVDQEGNLVSILIREPHGWWRIGKNIQG